MKISKETGMRYPSDVTDNDWEIINKYFNFFEKIRKANA